jgi:hypothetical protein
LAHHIADIIRVSVALKSIFDGNSDRQLPNGRFSSGLKVYGFGHAE